MRKYRKIAETFEPRYAPLWWSIPPLSYTQAIQMSLSNPSQALLRNIELLSAKKPIIINAPADTLTKEYLVHYPDANISCFNTNFADHQAIKSQHGNEITTYFGVDYANDGWHDLAIIFFPKSKNELAFTIAMLVNKLTDDAKVLIVGENKGGVKSAQKLTGDFLTYCDKVDSARHCVLYCGQFNNQRTEFVLEDWYQYYPVSIAGIELSIAALPGVFSQQALDTGTRLLLQHLPKHMSGKVLDFGCGAGVISAYIGKKFPQTALSLLDVNALALRSSQKTLAINGLSGEIFPSNGLIQVSGNYQHIVSNPPFHEGLKTNYQATETFLAEIKKHMQKSADISIVANSFLRYAPIMNQYIGHTQTLCVEKGFALYRSKLS